MFNSLDNNEPEICSDSLFAYGLRSNRETIEKWHNRLYKRSAIFAFLCWVPGVGDIFAVGLGLLRANILITAVAMLAGKFLRYVIWGWLTGLVF